jgi:hypothetical protein
MPSAVKTATLDIDAIVIVCDKRAAKRAYDGNRGYQPVLALWAEQDRIPRRHVPAGSGNRRVVEKALAALPGGIAKIYLRGDSALYEHEPMGREKRAANTRRSRTGLPPERSKREVVWRVAIAVITRRRCRQVGVEREVELLGRGRGGRPGRLSGARLGEAQERAETSSILP